MATTTTVCVVAPDATRLIELAAAGASNVAAEAAGQDAAAMAWERARRRSAVYTLIDIDPIGSVVAEWARRLVGDDHDLDAAIALSPTGPAPDYYLVADSLEDTTVHWYLGLLVDLSPSRVMSIRRRPDDIIAALRTRRTGPELPELPALANRARDYVPIGLSGTTVRP